MKTPETLIKKMITERDVVCKKCGKKCKIPQASKDEKCEDCKFENFMMECESKFKE